MKRTALKPADRQAELYSADPALDIPPPPVRAARQGDAAVGSPVHDVQMQLELALAAAPEVDAPYPPLVKAAILVGAPLGFWAAIAMGVARLVKLG